MSWQTGHLGQGRFRLGGESCNKEKYSLFHYYHLVNTLSMFSCFQDLWSESFSDLVISPVSCPSRVSISAFIFNMSLSILYTLDFMSVIDSVELIPFTWWFPLHVSVPSIFSEQNIPSWHLVFLQYDGGTSLISEHLSVLCLP